MSHMSLILPYVVEDKARDKLFTYDMEVAAILCLAEAERKKPKIWGVSPERISFILKLHYPLWAVPWEDGCLILDGLGMFSRTIVYMKPPDVRLFTEDMQRNTLVRGLYRNALKSHAQTFKSPIATIEIPMEAAIPNNNLLSTIYEYIKQGLILKENVTGPFALIPPELDEKGVLRRAEKLVDNWRQIQSDIKGLQYAISVIDDQTRFHEQKMLREIEQLQEMYDSEILHVKPIVEKRVERLTTERDSKIKRAIKATERGLEVTLKEVDRHEQKLGRLKRNLSNFQKRRDLRKRKGDKSGVSHWNREIRKCQDKISEIRQKIQDLSQQIERTRKEGEAAIKKLNEDYQTMINEERRGTVNLEASRDSEIAAKREEMEELRLEASSIINLIGQLIGQKRLEASKLKEVTIPWGIEATTMVCVPFYLVRYETEAKSKHHVYAPMTAMGYEGIVKRIQKTIWGFSLKSRIRLLLRPRKALKETLAPILTKKIREGKAFEEIVYEMGCTNNLLNIPDFRESLAKGMEELREEGWINSEERDAILNAYPPH